MRQDRLIGERDILTAVNLRSRGQAPEPHCLSPEIQARSKSPRGVVAPVCAAQFGTQ